MIAIYSNKFKKCNYFFAGLTASFLLSTSSYTFFEIKDEDSVKVQSTLIIKHEAIENLQRQVILTNGIEEHEQNKEEIGGRSYNIAGIALFSGTDPISSLIKVASGSQISHVGILLANTNNENEWFCLESTGSASEVLKGQYPHVRITKWKEVISDYSGSIKYRLFEFENRNRPHSDFVTFFAQENDKKSYPRNLFRLVKALFKKNKMPKSDTLKTAFCSELAAKVLMDLNLVKQDMPPANYIPADFSDDKYIPLIPGINLTPEFVEK